MHREKISSNAFTFDELFSIHVSLKYFRESSDEMLNECFVGRVMSKEEMEDVKGLKKTLKDVDSSLAKIRKMFKDSGLDIPSSSCRT